MRKVILRARDAPSEAQVLLGDARLFGVHVDAPVRRLHKGDHYSVKDDDPVAHLGDPGLVELKVLPRLVIVLDQDTFFQATIELDVRVQTSNIFVLDVLLVLSKLLLRL